jgi:predicted RNA-binding Zn-ribbon protein involved in translation (DUF1610 family)
VVKVAVRLDVQCDVSETEVCFTGMVEAIVVDEDTLEWQCPKCGERYEADRVDPDETGGLER